MFVLLILFLVAVAQYTVTHNVMGLGILVFIFGTLLLLREYQKTKVFVWKLILPSIAIGALVRSAVSLYDRRYTAMFTSLLDSGKNEFIIASGVILNHTKLHQYDFEDRDGRVWILKSEQQFAIGEILWVSGKTKVVQANKKSAFGEFDYDRWLKMKWYVGQVTPTRVLRNGDFTDDSILHMRAWVGQEIETVFWDDAQAGLLKGMLIWSKVGISKEQYDWFIRSGLVHLVAVSGGNIMMVSIFLSRVLFWMPYYVRLCFIWVGIVLYGMLCGADSSVIRAVIMWLLGLVALFAGKMVDTMRIVCIAMVAMLLRNPYYLVYDMGFPLSFAAVIWLVVTNAWWTHKREARSIQKIQWRKHWIVKVFSTYFIPTFGATFGVLPVLMIFSWQYNLTSLLGNIIIMPFVSIITISGFVWIVLGNSFTWGLVVWCVKYLLAGIYLLSDYINHHGYWLMTSHISTKLLICCCAIYGMYRMYDVSYKT